MYALRDIRSNARCWKTVVVSVATPRASVAPEAAPDASQCRRVMLAPKSLAVDRCQRRASGQRELAQFFWQLDITAMRIPLSVRPDAYAWDNCRAVLSPGFLEPTISCQYTLVPQFSPMPSAFFLAPASADDFTHLDQLSRFHITWNTLQTAIFGHPEGVLRQHACS